METNKSLLLQSTKWSAISEVLIKIASPIINIVLAHILLPEVFGLVATFTLVTSFAEVFTDGGFQKYLIQHEFLDESDREKTTNVAFWSNLLLSIFFWVVIFVFRNQIATLVGSEGHGTEISVLSLQIPLYCFSSIQTALFRRDFKFKELVPIRFIVSVIPILVTIPLAIVYRNCWAIIIGTLVKEMVNAVLLTWKSSWSPHFYYNLHKLFSMLKDCLWLIADSFMIWVTSYAGTLIISRKMSDYYLGLYKAGTTSVTPYISLIFTITSPVLFSAISRLQNNKEQREEMFLYYQRLTSYIVLPMGALIFSYRELVTLVLLGSNWMEATTLIGCVGMSLAVCIVSAQYNSIYFRAVGKPYVALIVQTIYAIIMVVALSYFSNHDFQTLSIVSGLINIVYTVVSMIAIRISCDLSILKSIKKCLPSIIGSIVIVSVSCLLKSISTSIISRIIFAFISFLIYFSTLCLFSESRNELKRLIKNNKWEE